MDTVTYALLKSSIKNIEQNLTDYEKYIKITVNLVGSKGNIPLGNTVYVYEVIDDEEILLTSSLCPSGQTTIKVPQGMKYKITASTDAEGFYIPSPVTDVAVSDKSVTVLYTEVSYPETVKELQTLAKLGLADKFVSIGDEFNTTYTYNNSTYDCPWIVVDIKDEEFEDGSIGQCVTLEMKYATIESCLFDAPHQEVATEENAIEGMSYIGRTGSTYTLLSLTAGDAIPYNEYTYIYHDLIKDTSFNIYKFGHNRYKNSAIRQWINSDKTAGEWYVAPQVGCCKPSQANSQKGFLAGLQQDFIDCVANTKRTYYTNPVTDNSEIDVIYDKFFLLTVTELYGTGNENEGVPTPYYKEVTGLSSPSNADNAGRIKYSLNSHLSAQFCWVSSANRGNSHKAWFSGSSGSLGSAPAFNSYRVAVACRIG